MAFYNRLKTMKSAPVGTIMPWSGSQGLGDNPDNVPTGWILCDGRTYDCALFPLLASILGNTYGPTDDAITGNFPDFDEGDLFRVPNLNGRQLLDLEKDMLLETKYQANQPDAYNVIGDLISEDGTGVTPPTIYSADTDLGFQLDPIDTMAGKIQNITLNDPTWSKTYYTIGRNLVLTTLLVINTLDNIQLHFQVVNMFRFSKHQHSKSLVVLDMNLQT